MVFQMVYQTVTSTVYLSVIQKEETKGSWLESSRDCQMALQMASQ